MPFFIKEDDNRYEKFLEHEKEHGWSPDELWSLDHTLAVWLLPRLIGFRDRAEGSFTPGCFEENKEWIEILNKMITAFELIATDGVIHSDEETEQMNEGLDLFRKYFFCLWY